jgi:hypothetical protein
MSKPQHARRRRRWQPWAKWLHLGAFTWSALFVWARSSRLHAHTFGGHVLLGAFWTFSIYAGIVLVGGYLLSNSEQR